jgi:predicted nuclease of predicted toxin-antitoxin system
MWPPVLLDENIEHEVLYRLRNYGHTVEHIDLHSELRKGVSDHKLAQYSRSNDTLIVTYDDDFETGYGESDYWGVLFLSDGEWTATQVADVVHEILERYPPSALQQMNVVGREWL